MGRNVSIFNAFESKARSRSRWRSWLSHRAGAAERTENAASVVSSLIFFLSIFQSSHLHVWRQAENQSSSVGPGSSDSAFTVSGGHSRVILYPTFLTIAPLSALSCSRALLSYPCTFPSPLSHFLLWSFRVFLGIRAKRHIYSLNVLEPGCAWVYGLREHT